MAAFGKFKCTTQEALDEETGERIPAAEISNLFFHHQQSLANEYVKLTFGLPPVVASRMWCRSDLSWKGKDLKLE